MIHSKPKKCKGTSLETKSFGCGKLSDRRTYGLCPSCKYDWSTKTPEGAAWFQKNSLQLKKKKVVEEKAEFKSLHSL